MTSAWVIPSLKPRQRGSKPVNRPSKKVSALQTTIPAIILLLNCETLMRLFLRTITALDFRTANSGGRAAIRWSGLLGPDILVNQLHQCIDPAIGAGHLEPHQGGGRNHRIL